MHRPEFVRFWLKELHPPLEVQSLLRNGYIPDLASWPPEAELPNNASARARENEKFLDVEIAELVASGAVSVVTRKPWCFNPLQVVTREGKKKRLVMDVSRTINEHIQQEKVKLTSLEQITENASQGDFFASSDMRKGYYHIKINEKYRRLFGIKWKGQFYLWNCCFLGLRDLVLKFTKFVKPIICLLYTSPSPRDLSTSRMPSSA